METIKKDGFRIAGITIRTVNQPGKAEKDIAALWGRFMEENIGDQLKNKSSDDIYCVYTNYEGDFTQPYDVILGFKVEGDQELPAGLIGHNVSGGNFNAFEAEGDLTTDAVANAWLEIWDTPLNRTYKNDYEVYGANIDPKNGKADIFVGVN